MALGAIVVLVLALRWVFRPSMPRRGLPPTIGDRGLLKAISTGTPLEMAARRAVLSDAGIRSTTGPAPDGSLELLVFTEDVERARSLLPPV